MIVKPAKSKKTRKQEERRTTLQKQYNKKEIGDLQFLKLMGALSFRCEKKPQEPTREKNSNSEEVCPVSAVEDGPGSEVEDCTRYVSDDLSSEELSGLAPTSPSTIPAALRTKSRPTKAKSSRSEKCVECSKGFAFWRQPPLQIQCKKCHKWVHLRHLNYYDEDNYLCRKCEAHVRPSSLTPDTEVQVSPRSPPRPQCSMESNSTVPDSQPQCSTDSDSTATAGLPSFIDFPEALFVQRMASLGFQRSKTQPSTLGDGDCLIHAVLDGYNNIHGDAWSLFDRKDTVTLR